ncbi:S16 family serine protease [Kocuria sp.]|uniref:YlbL family protein n=1 Tax=Kocuria sp. TaxID=1871328 RepID=UPI00281175D5|nr:S16 family serine protease [Kocuria sp.]
MHVTVPPRPRRAFRRRSLESWALLGSAGLLLAGTVLPAPFVVEAPGPTFNTVGEHDGQQLLAVSGEPSYPSESVLDLTTVYVSGGPNSDVNVLRVLGAWLDPAAAVLPADALYPHDVSAEDVDEYNATAMTSSQDNSVAAALTHLDRDFTVELVVQGTLPGGPAEGQLEHGDVLRGVDGTPIVSLARLRAALDAAGERGVTLQVERAGAERDVAVDTVRDETSGSWQLGVLLVPSYEFPVDVDFELHEVGGPSAGLMFALGVVDELTPGSLAGDRHVAGTGTITPDGEVGPIGGIRQKLQGAADAGAQLFLAPEDNCAEVRGHVPDGLTVVSVGTLDDAVAAAEAAGRGEDLTVLPGCDTR